MPETRSHILADGLWVLCAETACSAPYHLPGTPGGIELLPETVLLDLLDTLDPPTPAEIDGEAVSVWRNAAGELNRGYDLPAVRYPDGSCSWYRDGEPHREHDRPAIMRVDGYREWSWGGVPHREGDKPAVIFPNGDREWYRDGFQHRDDDKPAVVEANGRAEYWMDGKRQYDVGPTRLPAAELAPHMALT